MVLLQGHTLGQRQKYYNELVKQAAVEKCKELPKINYEESDVDNMIKIDLACNDKNLEYVLEVFKCDDLMYISRAIKNSTWLVTDPQYARIINPRYLHTELFPFMNAKAVTKLMLQIRRRLKNERRVQDFYWYVFHKNPKAAAYWLQNCSTKFVESRFSKHIDDIPEKLVIRLCRKSVKVFSSYSSRGCVSAKFLLKSHTEEYLKLAGYNYFGPTAQFNKKNTEFLLKKCPNSLFDNFLNYYDRIHLYTALKYLKTDGIKPFLIKLSQTKGNWWDFNVISPILEYVPREDVVDLLRTLLAIRNGTWVEPDLSKNYVQADDLNNSNTKIMESENSVEKDRGDIEALFYEIEGSSNVKFSNVYRWYKFVPFEVAFPDIKRFIFAESHPEERHSMLIVLLECAKYNIEHVKTVIQYYHNRHINEPYVRKITFVDEIMYQHDTWRFDDALWKTLNNLYQSLEVYIESTNKVQMCLVSIIIYNVVRGLPVHEVVEEKFTFQTLAFVKYSLNEEEQDRLFNYLYNLLVRKLLNQRTDSETGVHEAIKLLKDIWSLITDWKREETYLQFVIAKVAELGDINRNSPWNQLTSTLRPIPKKKRSKRCYNRKEQKKPDIYIDIASIYEMMKPYKKALFESSLVLNACEDVCLNALKHDPGLFVRHKTEMERLRCNNAVSLKRFLTKLRVYWYDTLATEWAETSLEMLQNLTAHKPLIRGVMTVLPHRELLDLIKKYSPKDQNIKRNDDDELEHSIRKYIANNLHLPRPQLPIEVLLWYAKGNYLQHSLHSVITAYYTTRSKDIRKYIEILFNSRVSVQKHGIRFALKRLKKTEIIEKFPKLWNSTKNKSIRTVIFTSIHNFLCQEKKASLIIEFWKVLSTLISNLEQGENNVIYYTLGIVDSVPCTVVGEYFPQAFLFIKSLPETYETGSILDTMRRRASKITQYLDCDFVENHLLGKKDNKIILYDKNYYYMDILYAYLLCSKDSVIQMRKYNNLLRLFIEEYMPCWVKNGDYFKRNGLIQLLGLICDGIPSFVFGQKMVMPIEMLAAISDAFVKGLSIEQQYTILRTWELTVAYLKLLEEMRTPESTWAQIRKESATNLAKICVEMLTDDIEKFFSSVYLIFMDVMTNVFYNFKISGLCLLNVLDDMLNCKNEIVYMLVLCMMPTSSKFNEKLDVIRSKIYCFPSTEMNLHYVQKFSNTYANIILDTNILDAEASCDQDNNIINDYEPWE